ncbi:ferric reductase family protein SCDLUD_001720 [Saccharomycodes ludwigii]|uniref:ferric reductase family protein n=1 Tax=Saccharomycodes ludwigii TaxID=36035 RepID=UPI001E85C66F|nr:hypothetical protein SCDLUD_001720 [Saccharomycodes ludwigii]KAH3901935.1 hypothetical protein SCDLUD_001720 [Saccharomycodes ludwigii]
MNNLQIWFLIFNLVFIVYPKVTQAKDLSSAIGVSCFYLYSNNLEKYPFDCPVPDLHQKCLCTNEVYMLSVLNCIDYGARNSEDVTKAYNYLIDVCKNQANVDLQFDQIVQIFKERQSDFKTMEAQNADYNVYLDEITKYQLENPDIKGMEVEEFQLQHPIYINTTEYQLALQVVQSILHNKQLSKHMGIMMLLYWGILVFIGLAINIIKWTFPRLLFRMNRIKLFRWLRKYLIELQFFEHKAIAPNESKTEHDININSASFTSNRELEGHKKNIVNNNYNKNVIFKNIISVMVPTRIESVIILGYFILMAIFICSMYVSVEANIIYKNGSRALRYLFIADRSGIIAITQYPLICLTAGRNNILAIPTGWNSKTFGIFHKYISRIVFVIICIHGTCYLLFASENSNHKDKGFFFKWNPANISCASGAFILLLSSKFIRNYSYELFKILHGILSMAFFMGTYYHIIALGWLAFWYFAVFIWITDYLVRITKIIYSGGLLWAECEAVMDHDNPTNVHSIKIIISHSGWWRPYPGCYVFLYFLEPTIFWESHPFMVVEPSKEELSDKLVFFIRVGNGVTRKLGDLILKNAKQIKNIPVFVEGPYGSCLALGSYNNGLFYAGGLGITAIYTLALDLAKKYKSDILLKTRVEGSKEVSVPNNIDIDKQVIKMDPMIRVLWCIPHIHYLEICVDEIMALANVSQELVLIDIYVTRLDNEDIKYCQTLESGILTPHNKQIIGPLDALSSVKINEVSGTALVPSGYIDYWESAALKDEHNYTTAFYEIQQRVKPRQNGSQLSEKKLTAAAVSTLASSDNCTETYEINAIHKSTSSLGVESNILIALNNHLVENTTIKVASPVNSEEQHSIELGSDIKHTTISNNKIEFLEVEKVFTPEMDQVKEILDKLVPNVYVHFGNKPRISEIVLRQVDILEGSVAIVSCGPSLMNRDVKAGYLQTLSTWRKDKERVYYFEKELAW